MPLENSIAALFYFEDMVGNIPSRQEELEIFYRRGLNGIGARQTGLRTQATQLTTVRFVRSFDDAKETVRNYQAMIGRNPVDIVQYGTYYGTYLIQSVLQERAIAVQQAMGTIEKDPRVMLSCVWTIWG